MNILDDFIDLDQAATELRYHPQTVRKLAHEGKLRGVKRGNKWFFHKNDIKEYFLNG